MEALVCRGLRYKIIPNHSSRIRIRSGGSKSANAPAHLRSLGDETIRNSSSPQFRLPRRTWRILRSVILSSSRQERNSMHLSGGMGPSNSRCISFNCVLGILRQRFSRLGICSKIPLNGDVLKPGAEPSRLVWYTARDRHRKDVYSLSKGNIESMSSPSTVFPKVMV